MGCSRNGSDKSPRSNKLLVIRHIRVGRGRLIDMIILLYLGKFCVIICSGPRSIKNLRTL